jgi:hypothetical protein
MLDVETLLTDSVAAALSTERYDAFRAWLDAHLVNYAPPGSQLRHDPDMRRAFGVAFARSFWSVLPLPRLDFRHESIPTPGRNEPCPCGSGAKYKHCCAEAPSMPFAPGLLWPIVLAALPDAKCNAALQSRHLPREALLQHAHEQVDEGHADDAISLLEPLLLAPSPRDDDIAGHMLDTLCNAYDAHGSAKRRKLALLKHVTALPNRSSLRSSAHQRLACIEMDAGKPAAAWETFRRAQQDDPGDPALGMLEVQLLLSEGRDVEARDRARFFRAQLRRRGDADLDPALLEFYDAMAEDPNRAMADVSIDMEEGAGRALADWLDDVRDRALPNYTLSGADSPDEAAHAVLEPPAALASIEQRWRRAFNIPKPFSVHPLPLEDADPWDPDTEAQWSAVLSRHPECFDSLDVLDDLATAVMLHPSVDQPHLRERLLKPLLDRAIAIVDRALATSTGITPSARVPAAVADTPRAVPRLRWALTPNRPALRAFYRRFELADHGERSDEAIAFAERLLDLNPEDNHGLRYWLSGAHLNREDPAACIAICERFPNDAVPDLSLDAALALYRLGRAKAAGEALARVRKHAPDVVPYLLEKRIAKPPDLDPSAVTLAGADRGWYYREAMRKEWMKTAGALEWAAKLLR